MPQKMEVVLFVLVSNFILKPCWFLTNQFSHFLFFPPAVRFHWHACPSCLRNLPSPAIYLNVSFRWNFYDVLKETTVAKSNQENLHLLGVKFNSESLPTLFFMMKHFGYCYVFFCSINMQIFVVLMLWGHCISTLPYQQICKTLVSEPFNFESSF